MVDLDHLPHPPVVARRQVVRSDNHQLQGRHKRMGRVFIRRLESAHGGQHRCGILQLPTLDLLADLEQARAVVGPDVNRRLQGARRQDRVVLDGVAEKSVYACDLAASEVLRAIQAIGPFDAGMRVQMVVGEIYGAGGCDRVKPGGGSQGSQADGVGGCDVETRRRGPEERLHPDLVLVAHGGKRGDSGDGGDCPLRQYLSDAGQVLSIDQLRPHLVSR